MILVIFILNILSFYIATLLRKRIAIKDITDNGFYEKWHKLFLSVFVLMLFYKFVLNFSFQIYLIGHYTDLWIGVLLFFILDVFYVARYPQESGLGKYYYIFRKFYTRFNIARLSFLAMIFFVTGRLPSVTIPIRDMQRGNEILIFDRFYLEGTPALFVPDWVGDVGEEQFLVYEKFLFFKKKVYGDSYHIGQIKRFMIKKHSTDSITVSGTFQIYKQNDEYYIKRFDIKKPVEL